MNAKGLEVVKKIEDWFSGYMAMPREYALVAALWVLNTWIFKGFDAVPYLVVSAPTKESGKTVFLEMIAMLSREGKVLTDPKAANLYRMLEARDGWMTICFDEAEKLSREGNELRPWLNSGYRRGQTLPRTMPGGKVQEFPVFCPKAFSLIGDVYDTLRGRSIVLWLARGVPARKYRRSEAEREAVSLRQDIERLIDTIKGGRVPYHEATWLSGRDEEIWSPLLTLAHAIDLPKSEIDRVVRVSADLTAQKTQKARKYQDLGESEEIAAEDLYAGRVLRDLVSVLKDDERALPSSVAVERLKAIPSGPWRTFRGDGLNEMTMASMLARYQALAEYPKTVHISGKLKLKGYHAVALRRALLSLQPAVQGSGEAQAVQS